MGKLFRLSLGAALVALTVGAAPLRAETPKDGLVMAEAIDDIISLDPAEVFEFSAAEIQAQIYDRLVTYPPDDVSKLEGLVAESWSVSDDGKQVTFKIRPGITFHSGNPLTAQDVAYSLQRVVKLNLSPGFILTQFGFTPENMAETIKATDDSTLVLTMDQPYAPTFLLYCLTAGVGSVVDSKLVQANEKDGDMGHEWLKTNSAGSGPFKLRAWKPNESVALDGNPDYWRGAPKFTRVITRHIPEPATQRLLLEKGDIDIARKLSPEDLAAVASNPEISITKSPKGSIWYLGLNQKNPNLAKPEVVEAMKYLVDYDAIVNIILKGSAQNHQSFLPQGFLGAISDAPYQARRRQGQGTAGQGGPARRVQGDDGYPQQLADQGDGPGDPGDDGPGRHRDRADPGRFQAGPHQVPRPAARHLHRQLGTGLSGSAHQRRDVRDERRQPGRRQEQDLGLAQRLGHPGHDRRDPGRRAGA